MVIGADFVFQTPSDAFHLLQPIIVQFRHQNNHRRDQVVIGTSGLVFAERGYVSQAVQ